MNIFRRIVYYFSKRGRYDRFIKRDIWGLSSTSTGGEADKIIYHIISVGIKTMELHSHILCGELNNGERFSFWFANLWYAWGKDGQLEGKYWDGSNDLKEYLKSHINHVGKEVTEFVAVSPTPRALKAFRDFLLSIDYDIFFAHFTKASYVFFKPVKSYGDLTQFNRNRRIDNLISQS